MASWRDKMKPSKRTRPTKISRNGQVVLAAEARRRAGLAPGDLVISVPVAPGVLLVEKVGGPPGSGLKEMYESEDNPLRGIWGPDPDAWLDELRGAWRDPEAF
jgi:bifunctional DNA-binding transcriptional regulator/antitoxin component of YhaV-PrlF toxin-antitoxin module